MMSSNYSRMVQWIGSLCLVAFTSTAVGQAAVQCGVMVSDNQYGPYDYVTENEKVAIVDKHHFPPHVEALVRPMWKEFGNDLSYTLQRIPNHHRALITLSKLGLRENSPQPRGLRHSIDCYFDFAVRFSPRDLVAKMIYAGHLASTARGELAVPLLKQVLSDAGENPLTHFNVGLLYVQIKRYDLALAQAHRIAAMGYMRPELMDMLKQVGQWQDP